MDIRNRIIFKFMDPRMLLGFYSLNEKFFMDDLERVVGNQYVLNYDIVRTQILAGDLKYRYGGKVREIDYVWDIVVERHMPPFVEFMTTNMEEGKSPSPKKNVFNHGWKPRVVKIVPSLEDDFFDLFKEVSNNIRNISLYIVVGEYNGKTDFDKVVKFFEFHDIHIVMENEIVPVDRIELSEQLISRINDFMKEDDIDEDFNLD